MARPNAGTVRWLVEMMCILALVVGCGSSTVASPPPTDKITGGASCPAAEAQNLTFSGAITGHVSCAVSTALCSTTASLPSLTLPLNARIGSKAVQLLIAFRFFRENLTNDQPGTYAAGRLGEEADSLSYGASLDGTGHWETPTPGGFVTLSAEDASGASGTVNIKLTDGVRTSAVVGSWRCVKFAGS